MPSSHLLDPQLQPLIEFAAQMNLTPGQPPSAAAQAMRAAPPPVSDKVESREVMIPGLAGAPDVRALLYLPKAPDGPMPAMLHIHGGGYIMGAPEMSAPANMAVAETFGAVVLSVDYRLAPATKYPGALNDNYAALAWLHGQAKALGVDPGRIGVSGESAGGGHAATLALYARDKGEYALAFQHLIFPMLDDRTAVDAEPSPYVGQFVWTRPLNHYGWNSLLDRPAGAPDVPAYAAAARATDLAGLPPTYMACGALDLFAEENLDYARRLVRAGVPTEFHLYPGAPHAFQFVPDAAVSKQAARDSTGAMARLLGKG